MHLSNWPRHQAPPLFAFGGFHTGCQPSKIKTHPSAPRDLHGDLRVALRFWHHVKFELAGKNIHLQTRGTRTDSRRQKGQELVLSGTGRISPSTPSEKPALRINPHTRSDPQTPNPKNKKTPQTPKKTASAPSNPGTPPGAPPAPPAPVPKALPLEKRSSELGPLAPRSPDPSAAGWRCSRRAPGPAPGPAWRPAPEHLLAQQPLEDVESFSAFFLTKNNL